MTSNKKENVKQELFEKFCMNFPYFKSQIKSYYLKGDNELKIYTKQGGKFIFTLTDDGFSLKS